MAGSPGRNTPVVALDAFDIVYSASPAASRASPRIMGTSVAMIERSYGTLIEGAGADIARRLAAFEAGHDRVAEAFGPGSGQKT